MQCVWKFPLHHGINQPKDLQRFSNVLAVGLDRNHELCLWAEVEVEDKPVGGHWQAVKDPYWPGGTRKFHVLGTGTAFEPKTGQDYLHCGSVITPAGFVWHVYEIVTIGEP